MKILKIVLIVVVVLVSIPLVTALFTKKDYALERTVIIQKPKQEVFDYIKLLKNQDNYSVWAKMDPNSKKEYKGIDGTVGFVSAWEGNNEVGKGEQTITKVVEGERLETNLHFIKPFEGKAFAYMTTEIADTNSTKVKWGFNSSMPYPMNIMLLFMDMEKMLGKDYETGLASLKNELEK